jgi:hypothetical protein
MDELDLQLSDVVLFELPTFEDAQAFRTRLRPRWHGWSLADDDIWLFAAELGTEANSLALLLREAQALLAERELAPVRFVVDNRVYVLEPAEPVYETTGKTQQAA